MQPSDKIYVAGHRGLVGSALMRRLRDQGYHNLVGRTHEELDLEDARAVTAFFEAERPDYVIVAAAKVGGIHANNTYPVDFLRRNLLIELNVIEAAYRAGVRKLLLLGSSCIYPKLAPQPIREDYLLTGALEPTNEAYAIAKIAGIKLCEAYNRQYGTDFVSVMPSNLYGPGDNFDLEHSHVIPALLRKIHEAKEAGRPSVEVWGSGRALREFLYVDDMADACILVMREYSGSEPLNVGTGEDLSIADLARLLAEVVGYPGELAFDASRPDGTPRKLLDIERIRALGWEPRVSLREGLAATYEWYLGQEAAQDPVLLASHGRR